MTKWFHIPGVELTVRIVQCIKPGAGGVDNSGILKLGAVLKQVGPHFAMKVSEQYLWPDGQGIYSVLSLTFSDNI